MSIFLNITIGSYDETQKVNYLFKDIKLIKYFSKEDIVVNIYDR